MTQAPRSLIDATTSGETVPLVISSYCTIGITDFPASRSLTICATLLRISVSTSRKTSAYAGSDFFRLTLTLRIASGRFLISSGIGMCSLLHRREIAQNSDCSSERPIRGVYGHLRRVNDKLRPITDTIRTRFRDPLSEPRLAMKCQFEHVTFARGCSIRIYHRQIPSLPFEWHHHPVYELTLTLNSRGWRFVGDHIGRYEPQDLVLVPSDMPHTWASTSAIDDSLPHTALVVWFTKEWALRLADSCSELSPLRKLVTRANAGLCFPTSSGARMESCLSDLLSQSPLRRLHTVQELLCELADTKAMALATQITTSPKTAVESGQLVRVLNLLHKRFSKPIRIEDLCTAANLSARSLHRLFTRHLGENVSEYLGRLRIG